MPASSSSKRFRLMVKPNSMLQLCLSGCLTRLSWAGKLHHHVCS